MELAVPYGDHTGQHKFGKKQPEMKVIVERKKKVVEEEKDPGLEAFLSVVDRSKKRTWENDDTDEVVTKKRKTEVDEEIVDDEGDVKHDKNMSDMDYLKTKVKPSERDDTLAEVGRLFVRNLPYSTTEEELADLFSAYGEITEVSTSFYLISMLIVFI